jgi:hypothetical protein
MEFTVKRIKEILRRFPEIRRASPIDELLRSPAAFT